MLVLLPLAVPLAAIGVSFLAVWLTHGSSGFAGRVPPQAWRLMPVRPLGPDDDAAFLAQLRRRIDRGDLCP